jgi:hypothetical protein
MRGVWLDEIPKAPFAKGGDEGKEIVKGREEGKG